MVARAEDVKPAVWHRLVQLRSLETQHKEAVLEGLDELRSIRAQIDQLKGGKHKDERDRLKVRLVDVQEELRLNRGRVRWFGDEMRLTIDHSHEDIWEDDAPIRVPKTLAECRRSSIEPEHEGDEDLDAGQSVIITGITGWPAIVAAERATFGRRADSVVKPFLEVIEEAGWRTPMASAMAMAETARAGGLLIPNMPVWLWAGIRSVLSRVLSRDIPMNEADHAVMVRALKDVADRDTEAWLTAVGGKDAELNRALVKAEQALAEQPAPQRKRKAAKAKEASLN